MDFKIVLFVDDSGPRFSFTNCTADTEFEIGSITKTFTNELLRNRMRSGEITRTTTAGERLGIDSSIKLVDLANHRSGLPRLGKTGMGFRSVWLSAFTGENPYEGISREDVINDSINSPRLLRGIERYSNLGVAFLGHCLGDYPSILQEEILTPLKMDSSYLMVPGSVPDDAPRGGKADPWEMGGYNPAGGIRSTGNDMAKWLRYLIDHLPKEKPDGWFKRGRIYCHNGMTYGFSGNLAVDVHNRRGALIVGTGMGHANSKVFKVLKHGISD